MLHDIDTQGNIRWYCRTLECSYHSCMSWDRGIQCSLHPNRDHFVENVHTAHISDPAIRWTAKDLIELPMCTECGEKTTLAVHGDIAEPVIAKDELTGKILQVTMPQGFEHHGNLWFKDADIVKQHVPHPAWAHLPIEQIKQAQEMIRSLAPNSPVDWMIQELTVEDIHSVTKHPAVDRHNAMAAQLSASGKVYVAPSQQAAIPAIAHNDDDDSDTSPRIPVAS
jgi:hypothetical protein